MLVYGFEAISFSYLISLFTNTVPGGFSLVTIVHILTGNLHLIMLILFNIQKARRKIVHDLIFWSCCIYLTSISSGVGINLGVTIATTDRKARTLCIVLNWIGRLFPSFGISACISKYTKLAFQNIECEQFPEKFREQICSASANYYSSFRKCCGKYQCGYKSIFQLIGFA